MRCALRLRAHTLCILWPNEATNTTFEPGPDCVRPAGAHEYIAPDSLVNGVYWAPGIIGTVGLIATNCISWEAVSAEGAFGDEVSGKARCWMLFSMILLFSSLGSAIWIFSAEIRAPAADYDGRTVPYYKSGATATFVQALLLFVSALVFRAVRRSGDHAI